MTKMKKQRNYSQLKEQEKSSERRMKQTAPVYKTLIQIGRNKNAEGIKKSYQ